MMNLWCYVKGEWVNTNSATINIAERGFRFGDGVFETIRLWRNTPIHFSLHYRRLLQGIAAIRIPSPSEDIPALCKEIVSRNQIEEGILRIYISRGLGSKGYLPHIQGGPTLVIETIPLPSIGSRSPLSLWVSQYFKTSPASLPIQHKLAQGLNSTLARIEAAEHGHSEALLLNHEGHIAEASAASIFWQDRYGIVHTPALKCGILAGISRHLLLNQWEIQCHQGQYPLTALEDAQDIIVTNAITGPQPVSRIESASGWNWNGINANLYNKAIFLWEKLKADSWQNSRADWLV